MGARPPARPRKIFRPPARKPRGEARTAPAQSPGRWSGPRPVLYCAAFETPHGQGVAIDRLRIGDLSFEVPSAKEVDQTAIDPSLPEPILAGIGSDILSRFVWTVDYEAGVLWIPATF